MDKKELISKIAQIEEQATCTLAEFPKTLTKERLRMIVALARYIRTELLHPRAVALVSEIGPGSSEDQGTLRSA